MYLAEESLSHIETALQARGELGELYLLPSLRLVFDDLERTVRGIGVNTNLKDFLRGIEGAIVRGEMRVGEAIERLQRTIDALRKGRAVLRSYAVLASWRGERAFVDLLNVDSELSRISRLVKAALESKLDVRVVRALRRGQTVYVLVKLANAGSSVLEPLALAVENAYSWRLSGSFESLYPGQHTLIQVVAEVPAAAKRVAVTVRYRNRLGGGAQEAATDPIDVDKSGEEKLEPGDLVGLVIREALSLEPQPVTPLSHQTDPIKGWVVRGKLGRGGVCQVLLVEKEGKLGAMKLPIEAWEEERGIKPSAPVRQEVKDRLAAHSEALRKLNRLKLTHVTDLLESGFFEGVPYVVEGYCERGSLARLIREKGRLSLESALLIGIQIAQTLITAYKEAGLLAHNDVKPENVLFDSNGVARLTDFHSASVPEVSRSARALGTPFYSDFENVDERSDVRGLARTIADALLGLGWRERKNPNEGISGIHPPHLRELLRRACSPSKGERPSMEELLSELITLYEEQVGGLGPRGGR